MYIIHTVHVIVTVYSRTVTYQLKDILIIHAHVHEHVPVVACTCISIDIQFIL